jgi:hypothetical protein
MGIFAPGRGLAIVNDRVPFVDGFGLEQGGIVILKGAKAIAGTEREEAESASELAEDSLDEGVHPVNKLRASGISIHAVFFMKKSPSFPN